MPHQMFVALQYLAPGVPEQLRRALDDGLDSCIEDVPTIGPGLRVGIFPDCSASMRYSVTGSREGAMSKVRCVDVAGLVSAVLYRQHRDAVVWAWADAFYNLSGEGRVNPKDSVSTLASVIASKGGGGTFMALPLLAATKFGTEFDLLIWITDEQSWLGPNAAYHFAQRGTSVADEWAAYKARHPQARAIVLCVQPYKDTQFAGGAEKDVLHVSGFTDAVFQVMADFAAGTDDDAWVKAIEGIDLGQQE